MTQQNLRIVIQKQGRLSKQCRALLEQSGFHFDNGADRLLSPARDQPLDLMLVRDDDIPGLVKSQVAQLGIVGLNCLEEKLDVVGQSGGGVEILRHLGFGRCRLSLALPVTVPYDGLKTFQGKKIATSYPSILQRYLERERIEASVVEMSGSVELAPAIGVADAICDLVSTGATLQSNGLREVTTILESEAVLIRPKRPLDAAQERMIERLLARFDGLRKANNSKYIMLNAPKVAIARISQLIPGMEKPTVLPLASDDQRVAIHAVAKEEIFWETMERLKEAGATSILVLPIEKIIE